MPVGHKVPDYCPIVAVDLGSTSTRSWISAGDAARGLHDQRHRKPAYAATKDNQNKRVLPQRRGDNKTAVAGATSHTGALSDAVKVGMGPFH